VSSPSLRWWQGLDRYCWVVLAIAALGWLFDTMDQNLFNLVRTPSVRELLGPIPGDAAHVAGEVKYYGGVITAVFLIGWSAGGFIFGILGDRLGRTWTMILTILIYACFTGLSAAVQSLPAYGFVRFMTGVGVGGEWAAGASLVAEVFPARSRPMALGMLQALSAVGNMMAAGLTLALGDLDVRWRWAYVVGAVPALMVLWIRRSVKEPEKWQHARQEATVGKELGRMADLFVDPVLRRNTVAAVLMATAGVGALWGAGFFTPDLLNGELQASMPNNADRGRWVSAVFLVQQLGAFFGIYCFAAASERWNRRSAFFCSFALAWASLLAFFWGVSGQGAGALGRAFLLAPILGFCTLGPFSGYTVYFPELFPTRLRATGCGFCYNVARVLAAAAPFALGGLAKEFGGFPEAVTVVSSIYILGFLGTWLGPETKGKPLPE
jgi:MFS family permease